MYDAVVGIHGRYEPYALHARPAADASDQAAVIAAAHRSSRPTRLRRGRIPRMPRHPGRDPRRPGRRITGIAFGTLVAERLIALRANDGRNANITFDQAAGARASGGPRRRPTSPMFVPWMGSVTPLVVESGAQFGEPGPPSSLTSTQYTTDFNEVKAMGGNAVTGSDRTDDQTATALFFSGNAQVQFTGALIDQAVTRHMDIVDSARMFAAVNISIADALIAVWQAKLLRLLAADHGDQPGRHRRQPRHRSPTRTGRRCSRRRRIRTT